MICREIPEIHSGTTGQKQPLEESSYYHFRKELSKAYAFKMKGRRSMMLLYSPPLPLNVTLVIKNHIPLLSSKDLSSIPP